jgi:hypothetical protein
MPLPKLDVPSYELTLLSDNKAVEYRPFLVKEEKLLLMALESKNRKDVTKCIYTILRNCILDKNIDVNNLASFDVEYIFLKIREKSMGEIITVLVQCPETKKKFEVDLNLNEVQIEKSNKLNKNIEISNKMGLILKFPTFSIMQEAMDLTNDSDKIFYIISNCIDTIYDENTTYKASEYTKQELQEFLESLPQNIFVKISEFYDNFPKLIYEKDITSPFTGNKVKVRLDNFIDFFD